MVRDALICAVPGAMATNAAVSVPHPPPGTQPDGSGETDGRPAGAITPALELPAKFQYVLSRTTDTRSPTRTMTVRPFSASEAAIVTAARGDGVGPEGPEIDGPVLQSPPQAVAQSAATPAATTIHRMG